jgi:hypothetical protein
MKTLIIGDSHGVYLARHLGTLEKGIWDRQLPAPLPIVDEQGALQAEFVLLNPSSTLFVKQVSAQSEVTAISPHFATQLAHYNDAQTLCMVSLHGNDHSGRFMCQHEVPFDFVCPHVPDHLALGRQIIPRQVMIRQLSGSAGIVGRKLQAIVALLPKASLQFMMPPPPIPDIEHLKSNPEAFNFAQHAIEDKWVRLKIYHAYCEALSLVCQQLGVPVLTPPAATLDDDGFLAAEFWQGATHATPAYYAQLLQQHNLMREPYASV